MKMYEGSGCIDPHILDFSTSFRRVVSFAPRPLYTRDKLQLLYVLVQLLSRVFVTTDGFWIGEWIY
jgi:hypothetical protein